VRGETGTATCSVILLLLVDVFSASMGTVVRLRCKRAGLHQLWAMTYISTGVESEREGFGEEC
jgi:hypothetical protein